MYYYNHGSWTPMCLDPEVKQEVAMITFLSQMNLHYLQIILFLDLGIQWQLNKMQDEYISGKFAKLSLHSLVVCVHRASNICWQGAWAGYLGFCLWNGEKINSIQICATEGYVKNKCQVSFQKYPPPHWCVHVDKTDDQCGCFL